MGLEFVWDEGAVACAALWFAAAGTGVGAGAGAGAAVGVGFVACVAVAFAFALLLALEAFDSPSAKVAAKNPFKAPTALRIECCELLELLPTPIPICPSNKIF